jgi:hypothetical protein
MALPLLFIFTCFSRPLAQFVDVRLNLTSHVIMTINNRTVKQIDKARKIEINIGEAT